jgi:hypothetical protein
LPAQSPRRPPAAIHSFLCNDKRSPKLQGGSGSDGVTVIGGGLDTGDNVSVAYDKAIDTVWFRKKWRLLE